MVSSFKLAAVSAVAALALPLSAHAQWWAQHPGYVHALSDLRTAYWLLQHHETYDPQTNANEARAMNEIRAAYGELTKASVADGKDINNQPPPEFPWGDHRGRLHKAMDLLQKAHGDISGEEDNPAARGLRDRSVHHIDDAGRFTAAAIQDWSF